MRRTNMARGMSKSRAESAKRMRAARPILEERAAGNCEICGGVFAEYEAHHRLPRARGGGDEISNLILICGQDHRTAHSRAVRAEENGWLLPSGSTPAACSLEYMGLPAFLTDDGQVLYIDTFQEAGDPDADTDLLWDIRNGVGL